MALSVFRVGKKGQGFAWAQEPEDLVWGGTRDSFSSTGNSRSCRFGAVVDRRTMHVTRPVFLFFSRSDVSLAHLLQEG